MLIVSDTTTITNLWQVGQIHLLEQLYGQIIVPLAVWKELIILPEQASFLQKLDWLQVKVPQDRQMIAKLLEGLDLGEAEAIALSLELTADFLVMDEAIGRKKAESLHIKVIDLLGILLKAKHEGLIVAVKPILARLEQDAGFYINPQLYQAVLRAANE